MLGGGGRKIGIKNRSTQMGWWGCVVGVGVGVGGIAGTPPNECTVICNLCLWKLITDVY